MSVEAITDVEPSELGMWPPPPGFVQEWVPDEGSRVATPDEHATRYCRRPRCLNRPVMALRRRNGWWLYCADHLYGRRIRNGVVEHRINREPE